MNKQIDRPITSHSQAPVTSNFIRPANRQLGATVMSRWERSARAVPRAIETARQRRCRRSCRGGGPPSTEFGCRDRQISGAPVRVRVCALCVCVCVCVRTWARGIVGPLTRLRYFPRLSPSLSSSTSTTTTHIDEVLTLYESLSKRVASLRSSLRVEPTTVLPTPMPLQPLRWAWTRILPLLTSRESSAIGATRTTTWNRSGSYGSRKGSPCPKHHRQEKGRARICE